MPITNEDWLPTYEELTVPELELTSSVLRAGAYYFGKYCDNQSKVSTELKNGELMSLLLLAKVIRKGR